MLSTESMSAKVYNFSTELVCLFLFGVLLFLLSAIGVCVCVCVCARPLYECALFKLILICWFCCFFSEFSTFGQISFNTKFEKNAFSLRSHSYCRSLFLLIVQFSVPDPFPHLFCLRLNRSHGLIAITTSNDLLPSSFCPFLGFTTGQPTMENVSMGTLSLSCMCSTHCV